MSLTKTFAIGSGALGALGGAVSAIAFGVPAEGVAAIAAGASVGAAGTSLLTSGLTANFNGKGPEAGIMGLFFFGACHLTIVPAAAIYTARGALRLTGLLP